MIMMAAMAQTETIIFFIILVPFVSFFYEYILSDHAARKSGNLKRNSYFKALHIRALKLVIFGDGIRQRFAALRRKPLD